MNTTSQLNQSIKLVFCSASWRNETSLRVLLYSPLAFAYLARHTPSYYEIDHYDEYVGEQMDPETIDADLVAVSSITPSIPRAYEIADKLKKRGITTVLGGHHASALPDEALEHFDSVILGEGEKPWKEFLADFEAGDIQKVYRCKEYGPLDDLGIPDRRFIHENYHFQSVSTSRGCPFRCSFCYQTINEERGYRIIPHDLVLQDLDSLNNEKIVTITDANFIGYSNNDIKDRKILLRKMIDRKYKFIWGCQTTVNVADDPELMTLMYKAGCRVVFVGFESSSASCLTEMNKNQNQDKNYKDIVKRIHKHKIAVIASYILGFDSHTKDYPNFLINELKNIRPDFIDVTYLTAYPGTPLFNRLEKEGRATRDWGYFRLKTPSIKFKHFTHEEILHERKKIYKAFFSFANITRITLRIISNIDRNALKFMASIRLFFKMTHRDKSAERLRFDRDTEELIRKESQHLQETF